ncbi:murein biosynthesis integral membrane protein MurJ [Erysipelothrix enhydrae]|uniref:murein biosynthesis integral membrane protein MurJ n=1 Tax=Erysipelothrix enhydrae TaxID=2890314 RepID=UPI002B244743|nr:murein biosynthesis integral membrane protein MurJ [Erysipelothrix sp. 4322-04]WRB86524.1 murein biosynthesis integral membrane protein MurJ [Erysipelothrix sp. 4322-04]
MKKTTIIVMFIGVLSKVLGFIRDITLSSMFGMGAITDAFNASVAIPTVVLSVIGSALITGVIPMLTKISHEDKERGDRFASNVLNIMIVFSLALSLFMFLVPEVVLKIVAGGFKGETLAYAVVFVRTLALGVFSVAVMQLGTGYLNVKGNFVVPAMVTIPMNLIVIAGIAISSKAGNPYILGYAQLIALIVQAIIILFFMWRSGFVYHAVIDLKDDDLRSMVALALPLVLSSFLGQFNDIVMKNYATVLQGEGGYSYMTYATKLIGFVQGIFIIAILQVTYPTIAKSVVEKDMRKVNDSINDAVLMIALFVLPAMVGFVTLARGIVEFVFLRGAVTPADISVIVPIFICDTIVLFAYAMRELMFRIHYAYHDMKGPVRNTVLVSVLFVVGMIVFSFIFGKFGMPLAGLSFAYSLAALISCVPLYKSMKKHIPRSRLRFIALDFIKITLAAFIMGVVVVLVKSPIQYLIPSKLSTIVIILVAGLAYLIAILSFKVQFVRNLILSFLK